MTDLTPGTLDAAAQNTFSYGACAGLAIAVHDATGWPLIKVADSDCVYAPDGCDVADADETARANTQNTVGLGAGGIHWLVLHPSGALLDVDGLHDPAEMIDRYDGEGDERHDGRVALGRTDREDAIDEYVDAKGEPVPLTVCAQFVDAVLDLTRNS